jgi:flagellar biosynthesis/type III secretory pathway protein FliH
MLRRIPKSELPEGGAPRIVDLQAPEADTLRAHLRAAEGASIALHQAGLRLHQLLHAALTRFASSGSASGPELLRSLVDDELSRLRRAASIELRVHPEDLAQLDAPGLLTARLALEGVLRVVPDGTLSQGDCLLESELGSVDARVETRIERLCALLAEGGWR